MIHSSKLITFLLLLFFLQACAQKHELEFVQYHQIKSGTQILLESGIDLVKNKKIGIVTNQASVLGDEHIVDLLLEHEVELIKIFSPEHGFRGKAEAGELIEHNIDDKTGLQVISLYGSHKKPTPDDLKRIDIMLFDLQDVGVRFYTYISTLTYVMEACAESNIPLIVLDRPNPNGFYVDGPVLDTAFSSFVGLHPIPIVYGLTIGEYAMMVNGERWLKGGIQCNLQIIELSGYHRNMIFELPIPPSPNLPNWQSVYLYPSLCLFEGTIMSIGRGTDNPFQIYGHPEFSIGSYAFTPESRPGASLHPKFEGVNCYGQNLTGYANNFLNNDKELNLRWLIGSYELFSSKKDFFTDYFNTLSGTDILRQQLESNLSENEIRDSWQEDLKHFKKIREKYLIYD